MFSLQGFALLGLQECHRPRSDGEVIGLGLVL